jgi:hypothetical protein
MAKVINLTLNPGIGGAVQTGFFRTSHLPGSAIQHPNPTIQPQTCVFLLFLSQKRCYFVHYRFFLCCQK